MDADRHSPPRVYELSRPEHMLIWALRAICLGHEDCPLLMQTFSRICGDAGPQALAAYQAVVMTIGVTARRRLVVHIPGCACVSADEQAMVAVVSAAQRSLGGDEAELRAQISGLTGQEPSEHLIFALQVVARVLSAGGHVLPSGPARAAVSLGMVSTALH
ncbi:MAG: hypothetical protein B7Y99_13335 [Caulobacterales bacterium 32-69-10]|nr:MAG: hypothetical protein B7Y99_13335 [Caulobacterales bacterium 32-69-10]